MIVRNVGISCPAKEAETFRERLWQFQSDPQGSGLSAQSSLVSDPGALGQEGCFSRELKQGVEIGQQPTLTL